MDLLWSPWRSEYIDTFNSGEGEKEKKEECFICGAVHDLEHDKERLVVARTGLCIALMNRYPYNGGHLLIAAKRHIGDITELTDEEANEIMRLSRIAIKVLREISSPHAFNIGMNMGRSAGAGLPGHLHQHIIPRWNGDVGFVTSVCDMKVISQALDRTRDAVAEAFTHYL